jgi:hypothetical protein
VVAVSLKKKCLLLIGWPESFAASGPSWIIEQLSLISIAATGWAALGLARQRALPRSRARLLEGFGVSSLALATLGTFAFCGHGVPVPNWVPLWLVVPLILWLESQRSPAPALPSAQQADKDGRGWRHWLHWLLPVIAAAVTVRVVMQVLPSAGAGLLLLSLLGIGLVAAAALRRSRELVLGLATQLVLTCLVLAARAPELVTARILLWWLVTSVVVVAGALLVLAPRLRRGSFLSTGVLATGLALASLCRLCLLDGIPFWPLEIWLAPVLGLWLVLTRLEAGVPGPDQARGWADLSGLSLLAGRTAGLVRAAVVALVILQTWMVHSSLEDPARLVAIPSLLALALLAAAVLRRSTALLIGFSVQLTISSGTLIVYAWQLAERVLVSWWAVAECALAALLLLVLARRHQSQPFTTAALVSLLLLVVSGLGLIVSGEHWFEPLWLWLLIPIAGWSAGELLRTPLGDSDRLRPLVREWLGIALATAMAELVIGFAWHYFRTAFDLVCFLLVLPPVLLVAAGLRRSPALSAALVTHLTLTNALVVAANLTVPQPATWWLVAETVAAAVVLALLAGKMRRGSLAAGSAITMGVAMLAMAEAIPASRPTSFGTMLLWLLPVLGLWVVVELLCRRVPLLKQAGQKCRDRIGLALMPGNPHVLGIPPSILAAGLRVAVLSHHLGDPATIAAVMIATALAVLATMLLRSSAPATAGMVLLAISHVLLHDRLGIAEAARNHFGLTLGLLVLTLAIGAVIEVVARREQAGWGGAGWYPYLLGFVLGHLFVAACANTVLARPWLSFPLQMGLAAATMALAWLLRLARLQVAALVSSTWVLVTLVMSAASMPMLRDDLLAIGLGVCLPVLLIERICTSSRCSLGDKHRELIRKGLICTVAVVMAGVLLLDNQVSGILTTTGWSIVALVLAGLGFLFSDQTYRRVGLVLFLLSVVRVATIDVAQAEPIYRILAFFCLGVCLVVVSFFYSHIRDLMKTNEARLRSSRHSGGLGS